ncbi:hypothetical protein [Sphingomonas abaci]|uniref:Uncharacterized protein n=1 Tax=Sphingomonas abaci TaxID=237611 RepID=A0A7W7EZ30_9SPHN|nr:hypothetical protein [Sphingomonas abaci]MBB4618634.1 hypothetical protein [Sphingomonas abaci]
MSNSEMVQPTQGELVWKNDPPNGEFFGMTRLLVSGSHWIHSIGAGPEVEAEVLQKMKEAQRG